MEQGVIDPVLVKLVRGGIVLEHVLLNLGIAGEIPAPFYYEPVIPDCYKGNFRMIPDKGTIKPPRPLPRFMLLAQLGHTVRHPEFNGIAYHTSEVTD